MVHGPQTGRCHVCGELTDTYSNAACLRCGSVFHLALRQDMPGKDCGQVWINDESQTLEFACNRCLGLAAPASDGATDETAARYSRSTHSRASDLLRARRKGRGR